MVAGLAFRDFGFGKSRSDAIQFVRSNGTLSYLYASHLRSLKYLFYHGHFVVPFHARLFLFEQFKNLQACVPSFVIPTKPAQEERQTENNRKEVRQAELKPAAAGWGGHGFAIVPLTRVISASAQTYLART